MLPAFLLFFFVFKRWRPNSKIRLVLMESRYFGHQCLEPEVFLHERQVARESGSRDIWVCSIGKRSSAINPYLWDLRRQSLPVIPSWIASMAVSWSRRRSIASLEVGPASIYRLNFLRNRPSALPLEAHDVKRRLRILSLLSEPERPYVVFTIRDPKVAYDPRDLRNREVRDFEPAMLALVEKGFNVMRVVSATDDPVRVASRHVLDWQVLRDGQPGDELALVSGASFVVSTTTGGDSLALALRRPVLYIDSARLRLVFLGTELATFQMPEFYDLENGKALNFKEVLDYGLGWLRESREFTAKGIRVTNSSPEQIREIVIEYLKCQVAEGSSESINNQSAWRRMLYDHHGDAIRERHGDIRAWMHPATLRSLDVEVS